MNKYAHPFLLIDIGNTRLKWATATFHGAIHAIGEIATLDATPTFVKMLAHKFPENPIVLTSVVPKLTPLFRRAFSSRLIEVSATLPHLGLRFQYPQPSAIGADRIAAATAAQAEGLHPAIIVACGTATAFTVLDAKGRLCGGVIAPGPLAQLAALLGATAQLPKTTLRLPRSPLAKSTEDAIRTGVLLGYRGGVKEILSALLGALPAKPKPRIILTGGNAHFLATHLGSRITLRPLLVFEGLRMIGLRTSKRRHEFHS